MKEVCAFVQQAVFWNAVRYIFSFQIHFTRTQECLQDCWQTLDIYLRGKLHISQCWPSDVKYPGMWGSCASSGVTMLLFFFALLLVSSHAVYRIERMQPSIIKTFLFSDVHLRNVFVTMKILSFPHEMIIKCLYS
jgi:hypothetical protein